MRSMLDAGPMTASAAFAPPNFRLGPDSAVWLGLMPREDNTGGKARLGHGAA